ncbi:MAG TPA: hypothetical protein VG939_20985 [Caulobacteraceae bacterium]|nr:hypothetical protein [Caulobacteraceae bacterium]
MSSRPSGSVSGTRARVVALGAVAALASVAFASSAQAATTPATCPPGYSYNRVVHACAMTQAPTCPGPYAWNASRKTCVSTQMVRKSCPAGRHLTPQGCAPNSSGGPGAPPGQGPSQPTVPASCPSGYAPASSSQCVSTATSPPQCQAGYDYTASLGLCLKSQAATCPPGYRLDTVHGVCSTGAVAQ